MKLADRALFGFGGEPFVGLLEQRVNDSLFVIRNLGHSEMKMHLCIGSDQQIPAGDEIILSTESAFLEEGDIVRFNPISRETRILYRKRSQHNFLFFTERCNSRCLMCSQPPRDIDDAYLIDDILEMIPWMSKDTPELGITGGEPTLLHEKLMEVIRSVKQHLPKTSLHMLSNGRLFSYLRYARSLADIKHPDFMIGIPLYADTASVHDFVVQAKGAFEQTLFGILNLARTGIRIELRMVIHRETHARLAQYAQFVARNLPFVDQVVFMGLELMGYARTNLDRLWIDPVEYQVELEDAINILFDAGIRVFIYNHQLCLLPPSLHPFARKSISDWKNIYMPACESCQAKADCGGFFASASLRYSQHIRPLSC
ncbi:His-Xaa-Ser system radical SAM maturase HxsC [Geminisphaera colitermitum]|uniref:His-Xaa-Ser system radical SAM maturase HxsC n=1 Tax=Geminisphaera colitermitum TaxID=1148786 RepID=UPI0012FEFB8F|nr:His-Xaa-Ser system radical SAM maturase HxsC [Geminisphaera colitermitum]